MAQSTKAASGQELSPSNSQKLTLEILDMLRNYSRTEDSYLISKIFKFKSNAKIAKDWASLTKIDSNTALQLKALAKFLSELNTSSSSLDTEGLSYGHYLELIQLNRSARAKSQAIAKGLISSNMQFPNLSLSIEIAAISFDNPKYLAQTLKEFVRMAKASDASKEVIKAIRREI